MEGRAHLCDGRGGVPFPVPRRYRRQPLRRELFENGLGDVEVGEDLVHIVLVV